MLGWVSIVRESWHAPFCMYIIRIFLELLPAELTKGGLICCPGFHIYYFIEMARLKKLSSYSNPSADQSRGIGWIFT